jgi:hypothetical protein
VSYVVHIWQSPVPRDNDHAWEIIGQLCEEMDRGATTTPQALVQFVAQITARYPNSRDLPPEQRHDDEHRVWGQQVEADGPMLALGILSWWVSRVQPFVVETANRLGLVCYDMQCGGLHLPPDQSSEAEQPHD